MIDRITKDDLAIYDNGGKTWDRYTVIIGRDVYGMSRNAMSPNGFNQYSCDAGELARDRDGHVDEAVIGKAIDYDKLPKEVQEAVYKRILSID